MRLLILEAFKLVYIITGARRFSYIFSLVLNSVMDVILLKGMINLLQDIFSFLSYLSIAFRFPIYIGTGLVLLFINSRMVPIRLVDIVGQIKTKYVKLGIFFGVSVILFLYLFMLDKYF